jgi:hypothetical protein
MDDDTGTAGDIAGPQVPAEDARTVEVLRRGGVIEHPPPPHVWKAVDRGIRRERGPRPLGLLAEQRSRRIARGASPVPRRGGGSLRLMAAAAAGALITWVGLSLADPQGDGEVLASGQLAPLGQGGTPGSAEVVEVDGQQRLRVELDEGLDAGDGYLEVWLLRPDVSGMVTLGVLEETAGEFLLPAGLDLGEYPVVDISREHVDGDPGHGGDSIVRGELG